jgi:hypothetical protein
MSNTFCKKSKISKKCCKNTTTGAGMSLLERGFIGREKARNEGKEFYFTTIPCRNGHVAQRRVKDAGCVECNRERSQKWAKDTYKERYKADPGKYRELAARRNATKAKATPKWLSEDQKTEMQEFYQHTPDGFEVDHIIPLRGKKVCGLHVPWNLQYLPISENRKKSNRVN